jgi:branched-chain amino acid transport system permease protein
MAGVVMLILWWVAHRIYNSPFGRTLRSIREDIDVSEAFGKNTFRYRMIAMVIGCFYAGIAGGLLIGYITAFNPSGWTAGETFVIWAALLIGGRGNNWGAILGALLVPVAFQEATRFLPQDFLSADLIAAFRNIIVGVLLILVLWFRPQGIIPERKKRFLELPLAAKSKGAPNVAGD